MVRKRPGHSRGPGCSSIRSLSTNCAQSRTLDIVGILVKI